MLYREKQTQITLLWLLCVIFADNNILKHTSIGTYLYKKNVNKNIKGYIYWPQTGLSSEGARIVTFIMSV